MPGTYRVISAHSKCRKTGPQVNRVPDSDHNLNNARLTRYMIGREADAGGLAWHIMYGSSYLTGSLPVFAIHAVQFRHTQTYH